MARYVLKPPLSLERMKLVVRENGTLFWFCESGAAVEPYLLALPRLAAPHAEDIVEWTVAPR